MQQHYIYIGGPAHGIVTKTTHKTLAVGGGRGGLGWERGGSEGGGVLNAIRQTCCQKFGCFIDIFSQLPINWK